MTVLYAVLPVCLQKNLYASIVKPIVHTTKHAVKMKYILIKMSFPSSIDLVSLKIASSGMRDWRFVLHVILQA